MIWHLWKLECDFEANQAGLLKLPLETLPAFLRGGCQVKAGFLQLENVGAYECFQPLCLIITLCRAKTRVRQARSQDAKYEEAHTFRTTLLIFCAPVTCLPHPSPSLDLPKK